MVKTQNQEISSSLTENTAISALALLARGIGYVCLKEQRPYSTAMGAERKTQFCIQASSSPGLMCPGEGGGGGEL